MTKWTHPIPMKALTQHALILATTRSGKSYGMHGLYEAMVAAGHRAWLLNPIKGDYFGLKSSPDGKSAGLPVTIFGHPEYRYTDIPITEHVGKNLARLVASGVSPGIIDLSRFGVAEKTRFATDFAGELLRCNEDPLYLFIDEAHNFMPGGGRIRPEMAKSLHAFNELVTGGLGAGIHIIAASQRPAKLSPDTKTQMDTMIAMRVIHPLDRDAVQEWIDANGDPVKSKEVIGTLGKMPRGEGWMFSADAELLERIKFPEIKTFDSHKTPEGKERAAGPKKLASGDLDKIRAELGDATKEAEANDPRALKRTIDTLRAELAKKPEAVPTKKDDAKISRIVARAVMDERKRVRSGALFTIKGIESIAKDIEAAFKADLARVKDVLDRIGKTMIDVGSMRSSIFAVRTLLESDPAAVEIPDVMGWITKPVGVIAKAFAPPKVVASSDSAARETIPKPHLAIIDAIAWWNAMGIRPTLTQAAFRAKYSPRSSSWEAYVSRVKRAGLVSVEHGRLVLTDEGSRIAGRPATTDIAELQAAVLGELPEPQAKIVRALIETGPMEWDACAAACGYSPTSSSWEAYVSRTRRLELLEGGQGSPLRVPAWLIGGAE